MQVVKKNEEWIRLDAVQDGFGNLVWFTKLWEHLRGFLAAWRRCLIGVNTAEADGSSASKVVLDGIVQTSDASKAGGPPASATTTPVDLSVAPSIHRLGPREQRHVRHLTSNTTTTVQVCSHCRHCLWLTAM